MRVYDIELSPAAVAELALILHRAGEVGLAQRVGRAADNNRDVLDLDRRGCEDMLRVLVELETPASLTQLSVALVQEIKRRRRDGL